MHSSPTPKTVRVSVPITPEVLAKFQRFSEASGLSLGKSIGEWLKDTVSGLDVMTEILETHKRAPGEAIAKFQGLAASLQAVSEEAIRNMGEPQQRAAGEPQQRAGGVPLAGMERAAQAFSAAAQDPRLVIRGGKSTKTTKGPKP